MFVAPIVALKINVKVDWSSCHFSQKSIYALTMGFHALTLAWSLGDFKNRGNRSSGYRGNLDQSIVHG